MAWTIEKHSFHEIVRKDPGLVKARARYADLDPKERRAAADLAYHTAEAERVFGFGGEDPWGSVVLALAIDPSYAPAMLTVGTLEYEFGRGAEGQQILDMLFALPPDTEDLPVILDKAAWYVGKKGKDWATALDMYRRAVALFPRNVECWKGIDWCLGHLGRPEEAVTAAREALALAPEDHELLNDLGWALVEAGRPEEAVPVLLRAIERAPAGYEYARNNLAEARRRIERAERRARRRLRKVHRPD